MGTTDICAICREESQELYQCCPTKDDSLCQSCWKQSIEIVIQQGKIALLFNGKLPCNCCRKPIELDRLPEDVQIRVKNILSTIPKSKTPKSIEEFNYSYNTSKELRHHSSNEKFIFLTQRHYNLLGSCLDNYIQSLMKNDPWNYQEIWLPEKDEQTNDHHDQVNIFTSEDFRSNENGCLILLQGSGVVRPGQWARSCCINESLDIGTMLPYMTKAKEHNLSVIILNPNQTSYATKQKDDTANATASASGGDESAAAEDNIPMSMEENTAPVEEEASRPIDNEENASNDDLHAYYLSSDPLPRPLMTKIPNLSTNREHVLYVYDHVISQCPAKKFYVVAHSAGGDGLMYLLRKRQDQILPRLAKIAFTDSVHSILPLESKEIKTFLKANAIHFVASDAPMGEAIDSTYDFSQKPACEEVSAGHPKHEYTSGYCVEGVFQFFFPPDAIEKTKL